MVVFGRNPSDQLIVVRWSQGGPGRRQCVDLDHRLPDGSRSLLNFSDRSGIILLQKGNEEKERAVLVPVTSKQRYFDFFFVLFLENKCIPTFLSNEFKYKIEHKGTNQQNKRTDDAYMS